MPSQRYRWGCAAIIVLSIVGWWAAYCVFMWLWDMWTGMS